MSALWGRVRTAGPWVFLAIGFGVLLVYAFPGYMSNDSFVQLMEARSGVRSDLHPPLMSVEWELLDAIVSGPILMLLLQAVLALFGLYRIARCVLSPRAAAIVASAVLVFPPVITPFAVIWKDSQMAAYFLAGIGCLADRRRNVRLLGLAAIAAGCAMRHNGLAAVAPLVGLLFVWRDDIRGLRRYAISAVAAVAVIAAALGVTRALTSWHVRISLAPFDIVGMVANGKPRSDAELKELLRDTPLLVSHDIAVAMRKAYAPRNPVWYVTGPDRIFDPPQTDAESAALLRAWWQLVRDEPGVYLGYRTLVFKQLIDANHDGLWSPVWNDFLEDRVQGQAIDHLASRSWIQAELATWFSSIADETVLFEPVLYLWLAVVLLGFAVVWRDRLAGALLASGLCYELAYFPVVATPDYRYSHWMITCTCLAAVLLFVRRRRTS